MTHVEPEMDIPAIKPFSLFQRSNPPCASNANANNSFICFSRNTFVSALSSRRNGRNCLHRKRCAEHRQPALRLFPGCFVSQDVPVLDKAAVLDPDNIRGDPGNRLAGS